ncbi:zinc finger MYND domain-containing protein 11-like isoform X1 [Haliotis asinina]|uniref:zinc finger MYND domain-containing protein 11-like isoform X1 n=1 Tax=Haliotis asinina TaxID=109174 RepID=UPI003531D4D2
MVRTVKRRQSTVRCSQQLLTAVAYIRQQKQIPNIDRLTRYMQRENDMQYGETVQQLSYVVKDGLLLSYTAVGCKGSKTGLEQEGFRIPTDDDQEEENDHDWYCFECHQPGEVVMCTDCWRVFHPVCTREDASGAKFCCSVCKAGKKRNKIKKKLLNTLLSYTVLRLKEKTRELHRIGHTEEFNRFLYMPMDLNTMETKVQAKKYKCLEEFLADAQNVLHNVFLLYGDEKGGMAELARIMIRDCKYDLDEIQQCPNCYYLSNAKPPNWFCQPCNPAHELVYAKQKGFSFWPAKVIKVLGGKYDVRFFGGYHQRAVIPEGKIKPISTNVRSLTVKRTAGFVKACAELELHQKLLREKVTESSIDSDSEDVDWEDDTDTRQVTSTSLLPSKVHAAKVVLKRISDQHVKSKKSKKRAASSPEDTLVVTSSEDNQAKSPSKMSTPPPPPLIYTTTSSTQTIKPKVHAVSVQTDEVKTSPVHPSSGGVNEEKTSKNNIEFETLKKELKEQKDQALSKLEERLKKDFEEDKQQAVSRALTNTQREIDRAKRQAEEKCKEQYMEEMKKLAQKHKQDISQTKKKQWCFNCEEEAMYHCCWNTSYCSVKCQQEHWHKEHKRVCRRKR